MWIGSKIPSESTNSSHKLLSSSDKNCLRPNGPEAGATFDNSFFDNSFGFLRQFKNGSFLDPVFVHVTGRSKN